MENAFAFVTPDFFAYADLYPGSLGTFRYRFQRSGKRNEGQIQAWVYENVCFELAKEVETETFPWTEEGMAAMRSWLLQKLEERGTEPYRIPWPPEK